MIRFSKIYLYAIATLLLAWLLPWAYHFVTVEASSTPFTMFSPITKSFAYMEYVNGKMQYKDINGTEYTEEEFDSIMPTFYYRQLVTDGRLPSQINGRAVSAQLINRENFIFRHSPSDINKNEVQMYPLFESESKRVDLEMPDDVFTIKDKIEFIKMKTNTVDIPKSEKYTSSLLKAGFVFPPKGVFGNPSTRKEYDNGYFLIDANGAIFHLKQIKGEPFVQNTGIAPQIGAQHIFVTEYSARHFFAFLTTEKGDMYVINTPDYSLSLMPLEHFNPKKDGVMIIGNMFYWTVKTTSEKGEKLYAVDADTYTLADDVLDFPYKESVYDVIGSYIFPFELSFTSYTDQWVFPRIDCMSWRALGLNVLLALVFVFVNKSRGRKGENMIKALCVIVFGLFMFIPLMIMTKN